VSDTKVKALLAQLRAEREKTLAAYINISREELRYATGNARWNSARRVMLRFADHLREHTLQIKLARQGTGALPTEPQAMLALAEEAWGEVLGATIGLSDDDLEKAPAPGQWSVRQVLEHMIKSEVVYQDLIKKAQEGKQVAEGE
jgi:hypothetical protein